MKEKEDESTIRRIISKLSFVREDLNAIEKLKIETPQIKEIISEIKNKVESLFDMLLGREKKIEE